VQIHGEEKRTRRMEADKPKLVLIKEVLKDVNIMRRVTSFLGRNDKQSLVFALSEEAEEEIEETPELKHMSSSVK
jgi:hypothetical protein